jgi:hypothetical protein
MCNSAQLSLLNWKTLVVRGAVTRRSRSGVHVMFSSRRPPMILVIYADGDGDAYVRYLTTAGFRAASVSTNSAIDIVDCTLATMPDMIVLDYDCDGETVDQLKSDKRTAPIPLIVLAEFPGPPSRTGFSPGARMRTDGPPTLPQ